MAKPTTEPSSITTVTTAAQSRTDALPTPGSNSSLPAPSPGNTAGGVPTGIKAGIGAGVGAVVLLLVMTAVFFIKRYRSNRIKQTEQPEPETAMEATDTAMTGPGELDSKPSEKALGIRSSTPPAGNNPYSSPSLMSEVRSSCNPLHKSDRGLKITKMSPPPPLPPKKQIDSFPRDSPRPTVSELPSPPSSQPPMGLNYKLSLRTPLLSDLTFTHQRQHVFQASSSSRRSRQWHYPHPQQQRRQPRQQ